MDKRADEARVWFRRLPDWRKEEAFNRHATVREFREHSDEPSSSADSWWACIDDTRRTEIFAKEHD